MSSPPEQRATDGDNPRVTEPGPAQGDVETRRQSAEFAQTRAGEPSRRGGILAALRRSPLVGADLDVTRTSTRERGVAL